MLYSKELLLGPTFWNIYYDSILNIPVPRSLKLIGYADDLAIVAVEKDKNSMEATTNRVTN